MYAPLQKKPLNHKKPVCQRRTNNTYGHFSLADQFDNFSLSGYAPAETSRTHPLDIQRGVSKSNETGIPSQIKESFELKSGFSFDDVQVHYNSDKPSQLQALAYTQGNQVYIKPGQTRYLEHELGHVVQQKRGIVSPTREMMGLSINDDAALEKSAEDFGHTGQLAENGGFPAQVENTEPAVIQCAYDANFPHVNFISDTGLVHLPQDAPAGPVQPRPRGPIAARGPARRNPGQGGGEQVGDVRLEDFREQGEAQETTMVFETFGNEAKPLRDVFLQSLRYKGKTICVLGINVRVEKIGAELTDDAVIEKVGAKKEELSRLLNPLVSDRHQAIIVPFLWGKTENMTGGYELPYFEVRGKLMGIAQQVTSEEYNVLYRWIDRDAQGDTSSGLGNEFLSKVSEDPEPRMITGSYGWRVDDVQPPGMNDFLTALNAAEKDLRRFFFKLLNELSASDKNSARFYLPEPTLIMNRSAHGKAMASLKIPKASADQGQSRESDKAREKIGVDQIQFAPELTVSKPDKKIDEKFYLLEIRSYLADQNRDQSKLVLTLKKTRQSAFDNGQWNFVPSSVWEGNWEAEKKELNKETTTGKTTETEPDPTTAVSEDNPEVMLDSIREKHDGIPISIATAQALLNCKRTTAAKKMFDDTQAVFANLRAVQPAQRRVRANPARGGRR